MIEDRIEQRNVRGFGKKLPTVPSDSQYNEEFERERNAYLAYQ